MLHFLKCRDDDVLRFSTFDVVFKTGFVNCQINHLSASEDIKFFYKIHKKSPVMCLF